MREVDPALIARRVRFLPYSSQSKVVCLRVELYGCVWTGKSRLLVLGPLVVVDVIRGRRADATHIASTGHGVICAD